MLLFYLIKNFGISLFYFKSRRLLYASFQRKIRWEFWPPYIFYIPVVFYILYLGFRYRCLTLFTISNPAIKDSGVKGESKSQILNGLKSSEQFLAKYDLIPAHLTNWEKLDHIQSFLKERTIYSPFILKPDQGERGKGVEIIYTQEEKEAYVLNNKGDFIVQEFVEGEEYAVFYLRLPQEENGKIFSITHKKLLKLIGDGKNDLETLILKDSRAVLMAPFHFKKNKDNLGKVFEHGEKYQLVTLGTHCQGSIFIDANHINTPALEKSIDKICKSYKGFYFGRFDIRIDSLQAFQKGKNFKILELNGVTSEATHIYDPKGSLLRAYSILFSQWEYAFEIGYQNRKLGANPISVIDFFNILKT